MTHMGYWCTQNYKVVFSSIQMIFLGFACFKSFFENVNIYEHKLKKPGMVVEKLDLIGLDFLWQVCLNTPDSSIAESGIEFLMTLSYSNLSPKLKRVSCLHFILLN